MCVCMCVCVCMYLHIYIDMCSALGEAPPSSWSGDDATGDNSDLPIRKGFRFQGSGFWVQV